jgi:hypothetical protein
MYSWRRSKRAPGSNHGPCASQLVLTEQNADPHEAAACRRRRAGVVSSPAEVQYANNVRGSTSLEQIVTRWLLALQVLALSIACVARAAAEERRRVEPGIPSYYKVKPRCIPERGYIAMPEAPGHPTELPFAALWIFNGEVIGLLFEAHERDGWRPWYDEPEGQAVSHDGGPRHYSQQFMFKPGPTAEQCKASKGAHG